MSMDLDKIESDANSAEKDIEILCSLVDNSVNTVYVCDSVTDELIYMNKAAEKLSGCHFDRSKGSKCYETIMNYSAPCSFCPKCKVPVGGFHDEYISSPENGRLYHVNGRRIKWHGRELLVYFVSDTSEALENQKTQAILYQGLVDESTTAVVAVEKNGGKVLFSNRAWRKQEGLSEGTAVEGLPLRELIPEDKLYFTDSEAAELPDSEYVELHKMSSLGCPINVYARSILWEGTEAYVCYSNDESDMWNSNRELQELVDKMPGGMGIYEIIDGKASLSYLNDAYYEQLGFSREERKTYLGANVYKATNPEDLPVVTGAVRDIVNGKDKINALHRVRNSKGEWVWLNLAGSVVERRGNYIKVYASFTDCNEMMKTQRELISNRLMVDAALKSAKIMAWRYDYKHHRITDSGSLGTTYHLPKVIENVPECLIDAGFFHEDSIEDFRKLFTEIPKGETVSVDVKAVSSSNEGYVWERLIYSPVFDEKGEYIESIGTSVDITEQKEREENYEEQLRLKKMLAKNALAVAHYNLTRNIITEAESDNPRLSAIMEASTVDRVLENIRKDTLDEDERQLFMQVKDHLVMLEAFSHGTTHIEIRHHLKDDPRTLESRFDMISNPYTGEVEAMAALWDISEAVRAEQVISTLISIDYDSIVTVDMETGESRPLTKDRQNDEQQELRRLQAEHGDFIAGAIAFIKRYCAQEEGERVLRELDSENIRRVLSTSATHTVLFTMNFRGRHMHKRLVCTYLDEGKRMLLCAVQDVTDTYEQEELQKHKMAEALKTAELANRSKTDFFSRMSHDMRTPMNGILGLAELSEEETDVPALRKNISKIKESGQYLLSLINDTLDFQRIESGRLKLEPQIVNCREILSNIVDMIKPAMDKKGIEFKLENKNVNLDWYIRVDPVRIKQIFINLLSNAAKFTPEGGSVTVEYECLKREGMVSHDRFVIRDTGIGMSQEFLESEIFKPFSQEYSVVSSDYAGSGLGLSIVHSLVELMGGTIIAESELGKGSAFTITMDFERVENRDAARVAIEGENKRFDVQDALKGKHILLVEDHPLNAEIALKLLARVGCKVDWMKNGREGLERFSVSPLGHYDAVLMDIRMPVMNGLEAARAIRSLERRDALSTVVIAMTANAYDSDVKQSIDAGMNAHLAKPINPMELYETLAKLI